MKVYYEEEVFIGKVLTKTSSSVQVKCLKHLFAIHVPQDMESEKDTVYYDTVYSNDGYMPELKSVGRGWTY